MSFIAVDMTPVLPGGMNGGAKIVSIELLKLFQIMAPEDRFLLLTASWNHKELAILDSPSMSRLCILTRREPNPEQSRARPPGRFERYLRKIFRFLRQEARSRFFRGRILNSRGVDLLFCPFTALTYAEPSIPVVSVIHDLQHRDCPQFFSSSEIDLRDSFLSSVCRQANAIVCVSEYTRQAVLRHMKTTPEKIHNVHNCIQERLVEYDQAKVAAHLVSLGINQNPYMFYPANFWPHKNHRMLLTAYGMFLSSNPDRKIDLAFTGALEASEEELKCAVRQMGLVERVHFLGFLPQDQVAAVWQGCEFLIFPSLYEGFGIPLLEAMTFGKPVLCSNITSLPEIAGDAALYFDPRKPGDIVRCLERIAEDPSLGADMVRRGHKRVVSFRAEDMAQKYLEIFRSTIRDPGTFADGITGVFDDGWTDSDVVVTHSNGLKNRILEIRVEAPGWLPSRSVKVKLLDNNRVLQQYDIRRGEEISIRHPLPEQQGHLTISVAPTFRPSECDMGDDNRTLGVMWHGCWLISPDQDRIPLSKGRR